MKINDVFTSYEKGVIFQIPIIVAFHCVIHLYFLYPNQSNVKKISCCRM